MKFYHLLFALLLAGSLNVAHVNASPTLNHVLTIEGGIEPTPEEQEALRSASAVCIYTYNDLLDKYVRSEVHVNVIDPTHCQVCVETSPGNFIIIDLEEEE